MKKVIVALVMFLIVGCGSNKNTELVCTYNDLEFEEGKMNVTIIYGLDKQGYVKTSSKSEHRFYENKKDATSFYEKHKDYSRVINEKEIEYLEAKSYTEKYKSDVIKDAMEGQKYICEYKK